jgi:hypothetical protein
MAKKHDFSDKKNSVCHAPLPLPFAKICTTPIASPLQARKLKILAPLVFWANLISDGTFANYIVV